MCVPVPARLLSERGACVVAPGVDVSVTCVSPWGPGGLRAPVAGTIARLRLGCLGLSRVRPEVPVCLAVANVRVCKWVCACRVCVCV